MHDSVDNRSFATVCWKPCTNCKNRTSMANGRWLRPCPLSKGINVNHTYRYWQGRVSGSCLSNQDPLTCYRSDDADEQRPTEGSTARCLGASAQPDCLALDKRGAGPDSAFFFQNAMASLDIGEGTAETSQTNVDAEGGHGGDSRRAIAFGVPFLNQ